MKKTLLAAGAAIALAFTALAADAQTVAPGSVSPGGAQSGISSGSAPTGISAGAPNDATNVILGTDKQGRQTTCYDMGGKHICGTMYKDPDTGTFEWMQNM